MKKFIYRLVLLSIVLYYGYRLAKYYKMPIANDIEVETVKVLRWGDEFGRENLAQYWDKYKVACWDKHLSGYWNDIEEIVDKEVLGKDKLKKSPDGGVMKNGVFWVKPVRYNVRISSDYGFRIHPLKLNIDYHKGVDISCPVGTSVVAVADGLVIDVSFNNRLGYYVKIKHGRFKSIYGHLKAISVKKNQTVHRGDNIAISGNTGTSTGPHLHFGLYKDGDSVDPERVIHMH